MFHKAVNNETTPTSAVIKNVPFFQPNDLINPVKDAFGSQTDTGANKIMRKEMHLSREKFFKPAPIQHKRGEEKNILKKESDDKGITTNSQTENHLSFSDPKVNLGPNSVAPGDKTAKSNFQARINEIFKEELGYIAQKIEYKSVGSLKGEDVMAFSFTGDINTAKNLINNSSLNTKQKLLALTYLSIVSTNNVLNIQSPGNSPNIKEQNLKINSEKYEQDYQDYMNNPKENEKFMTDNFPNEKDKGTGKIPTTSEGNEIVTTRNTDASANDLDMAAREFSQKLTALDTSVKIEIKDKADGKIKILDSEGNVQDKPVKQKK